MNGTPIQQADHPKYLGVSTDKNLNWNEHTRQVVSKANRVRGFLQWNILRSVHQMLKHRAT